MSFLSPQVSEDLVWQIAGKQNAYLVKRSTHGGVRFSRDPLNLTSVPTRKDSGFINDKAVGIVPIDGEKGGLVVVTKKSGQTQKPGAQMIKTAVSGKKTTRGTYKGIVNSTAKSEYRFDLRGSAVSRASAIKKSQRPVKETPASKPRGAKAKAAAAAAEE